MNFKDVQPIILGIIGLFVTTAGLILPQNWLWGSIIIGVGILLLLVATYIFYTKSAKVVTAKLPTDETYNNHLKHIMDCLGRVVGEPDENGNFKISEEGLQEFVTTTAEETRSLYFGKKDVRPHNNPFPLNHKRNCKICKMQNVPCSNGLCSATISCGLHVEVWQKL